MVWVGGWGWGWVGLEGEPNIISNKKYVNPMRVGMDPGAFPIDNSVDPAVRAVKTKV